MVLRLIIFYEEGGIFRIGFRAVGLGVGFVFFDDGEKVNKFLFGLLSETGFVGGVLF